jgi:hypothetical protein
MAYPSPETRTVDSKRHRSSSQPPIDVQSKDLALFDLGVGYAQI